MQASVAALVSEKGCLKEALRSVELVAQPRKWAALAGGSAFSWFCYFFIGFVC